MRLLGALVKFNCALSLDAGVRANADMLNEALRRADRCANHDHLVCVITDGFGFDEESRRLMSRLARNNDVLVGFVYDPLEANLPEAGSLVMSDGQRQLEVNSDNRRIRDRYRESFEEQFADDRRFLIQRSAPVLPIRTDQGVPEQLQKLLGVTRR